MEETRFIEVGELAPDFTLQDQDGKDHHLADYRGQKVLLSFHPLAWTSVCAKQMQSLEDNFDRFTAQHVVPFGLSIDSTFTKHEWAKSLGIQNVRLLSDFWPHGGVAISMSLFREAQGTSKRANVLLDEEGKVLWVKVYPIPQLPDIEEVFRVIEKK
jgi:peroxiredoxin